MASQAGGILLCKTFSAVSFSDQTKMSFSFFSFFRPAGEEWVRRGSSATFSSSTDRLLYIHWEMGKRMNSARLTEHRNLRMRRGPCQWFTDFQSIVWRWICLCRERERKMKARMLHSIDYTSFHFLPSGENAALAAVKTDDMASHLMTLSTHEELIGTIP